MTNRLNVVVFVLIGLLLIGQVAAYLIAPAAWLAFVNRLPLILAQIGFWGPICLIVAAVFVAVTLRMLGFRTLAEIRTESVEENNPAPAIVFTGTFIASLLFLLLVIRP
ncbi:MAG: hypothetical protein U0559_07650 [Anaerolineae bacterium]